MSKNKAKLGLLAAGIVALLFPILSQAQHVATGVINGSVDHKGGIILLLMSDTNGVALTGSSTPTASLNFGTISKLGTLANGITRTTTANSFTVSTPVDVYVDLGGAPTSFNLSASLASSPGLLTYKFGAMTLSTASQIVSQNDSRYGTQVPYALAITIPTSVAAGAIGNTINFTATAN
jgi:hypothetical protein